MEIRIIQILGGDYCVLCNAGWVHKLRWQDFSFFWPPTLLRWHFLWYTSWQKVEIIGLPTYLPTSSCKRILWTPPYLMFFLFICSFRNWWFSTNPETFGSCDRTSWGNCSNAKGLWVHTFQTHFSRPTSQGSSKSSQPTSISLR